MNQNDLDVARAAGRDIGERLGGTPLTPRQRAVISAIMGTTTRAKFPSSDARFASATEDSDGHPTKGGDAEAA